MSGSGLPPDEVEEPADKPPTDTDDHGDSAEATQQLFDLVPGGGTFLHDPPGHVQHLRDLVGWDSNSPLVTVHVETQGTYSPGWRRDVAWGGADRDVAGLVDRQQVVPGRDCAGPVHDTQTIINVWCTGSELGRVLPSSLARGGGDQRVVQGDCCVD